MTGEQVRMDFMNTPEESYEPQNMEDFFGEEKADLDAAGFKLADSLGEQIKAQRDIIDAIAERASEENAKLNSLQAKMIALLEHHGKTSYTVKGVGTFGIAKRESVKIPRTPEELEAFKNYLHERGVPLDLIFKPNSASLNSFYNEELQAAEAEGRQVNIPGLGAPTVSQTLRLTAKGK